VGNSKNRRTFGAPQKLFASAACSGVARIAVLALSSALIASNSLPATATSFQTIRNFENPKLGEPWGRLLLYKGTLIGTGSGNTGSHEYHGQVFRLKNSAGTWSEKGLLKFAGTDGYYPLSGLINSGGFLFGTANQGDAYKKGNVFILYNTGTGWVHGTVWAFGGTSGDGTHPAGDLVADSSGNIYGTTAAGGANGGGTVFELSENSFTWTETILHSFSNGTGTDGYQPASGLVMDSSGNIYGTTMGGGVNENGVVFQLTKSGDTWNENILHAFTGNSDGATPFGGLILGSDGTLYGTTDGGGNNNHGVVFSLSQSGGVWTENVLHFFNGSDGDGPLSTLTWGSTENTIYGTTAYGGTCADNGTAFEMTNSGGTWTLTTLHTFCGTDGGYVSSQPILDKSGNLYGTTWDGGTYNYGTAWEITP
jgi:uncharacterized repeat protein (TIGR03803 family)